MTTGRRLIKRSGSLDSVYESSRTLLSVRCRLIKRAHAAVILCVMCMLAHIVVSSCGRIARQGVAPRLDTGVFTLLFSFRRDTSSPCRHHMVVPLHTLCCLHTHIPSLCSCDDTLSVFLISVNTPVDDALVVHTTLRRRIPAPTNALSRGALLWLCTPPPNRACVFFTLLLPFLCRGPGHVRGFTTS